MNFLSLTFTIFLIFFLILYWAFVKRPRVQNTLMLAASYLVVGGLLPYFAMVLAGYTLGIWLCSRLVMRWRERNRRALALAVVLAVANLAVFKYFDFFRGQIDALLTMVGLEASIPALAIIAPLGMSFYTFNSISYLVSLHRKEIERASLHDLALFLAFFPSVVAGPINRAKDLLPQIRATEPRSLEAYPKGLMLMVFGIVKVVWLSAFLANTWANPVFANPLEYNALDALLGLLAYTWQLYFNFSGYTDLVTGMALLFGFRLPLNFNAPYLASNLRDFWRRWHISLSLWIRDYIYIPLGGSRCRFSRTQFNLMVAMVLSGLWHGASANFLIWGALHGIGSVGLNITDKWWGRDRVAARWPFLATFTTFAFVTLAWLFFRSPDFGQSLNFLRAIFTHFDQPLQFDSPLYLSLMLVGLYYYRHIAQAGQWLLDNFQRLHWTLQPAVLTVLAGTALVLSPAGIPAFIYASF